LVADGCGSMVAAFVAHRLQMLWFIGFQSCGSLVEDFPAHWLEMFWLTD